MRQNPSDSVIAAGNLAAGYRGSTVWEGGNFGIEHGEFVAVIGPNGAGKTTLFRLLLGLLQPVHGTIKVLGERPKRGNAKIGYVPQRHVVDEESGIESAEFVRLGFSGQRWGFSILSSEDRKAAEVALRAVGATQLQHRSVNTLSGGELQRIFLAEALVSNPDILLLDEPLTNLDMRRERELLEVVKDVVDSRKVTALLIAHNINPLLPFLDKVIYVANGKMATGTPEQVLTSDSLTALYGVPIEVLHDSKGNIAIIGIENNHHLDH